MNDIDPIDHASKTKGLMWLVGACLLGIVLAYGMAPLAHAIPWHWEQKMADAIQDDQPACHSTAASRAALEKIVNRLYPVQSDDDKFTVDVRVVKSPVVNAYAGLGGHITVNSALLEQAQSPEELAGVLAHEMEHVRHRHIMQSVLTRMLTGAGMQLIFTGNPGDYDWAAYFLRMNFTRGQEAQADRGGLARLQKAHIDNTGFKNFFERMDDGGIAGVFLSDHPSNESRIAMVSKFKNENTTPIMPQDEWVLVKHYCK